jgi:hypothetical protein
VIYRQPGSGAQEKLENPPRSCKNAGGNRPTFFQASEGFE